jgi:hypothetical protein
MIEVVDGRGHIMKDLNGNPAAAFIHESSKTTAPVGPGPIMIPDVIPFETVSTVNLVEHAPDPTTHIAPVSNVVGVHLVPASAGSLLEVDTASDSEVPLQTTDVCGVNPSCIVETGGREDVTGLFSPSCEPVSFRVLVQSDPPEGVSEPGTLLLPSSWFGRRGTRGPRSGSHTEVVTEPALASTPRAVGRA